MSTPQEGTAPAYMLFDTLVDTAWKKITSPLRDGISFKVDGAAKEQFAVYLKGLLAGYELTRWISVEDRLPENGVEVLLYRPDAHLSNDPHYRLAEYRNGKWTCAVLPTHWMPLPAAPEDAGALLAKVPAGLGPL